MEYTDHPAYENEFDIFIDEPEFSIFICFCFANAKLCQFTCASQVNRVASIYTYMYVCIFRFAFAI